MYVNFDNDWLKKQGRTEPATILGYKFDGDSAFTKNTEGFSVPCTTEDLDGDLRIFFKHTFRVRWTPTGDKADAETDWFGKTSVYFPEHVNLSNSPKYKIVAPQPEIDIDR